MKFYAFDCLSHGREDLRGRPLAERKEHLEALLFPGCEPLSPLIEYVDALPGEGEALLKAACGLGLKGIVCKRLDAPYTGGAKRLETWRKAKCRPSQEIVIGGWETDGARFRSLLAGVYDGGAFRYVGSVGIGAVGTPRPPSSRSRRRPYRRDVGRGCRGSAAASLQTAAQAPEASTQ